jgi:hypothetical protein
LAGASRSYEELAGPKKRETRFSLQRYLFISLLAAKNLRSAFRRRFCLIVRAIRSSILDPHWLRLRELDGQPVFLVLFGVVSCCSVLFGGKKFHFIFDVPPGSALAGGGLTIDRKRVAIFTS